MFDVLEQRLKNRPMSDSDVPDDAGGLADEQYLGQVLGVVEGAGYVVDVDGRLLDWNERFATTTGRTAEELDGSAVADFVVESDREAVVNGVETAVETGETTAVAALDTADGPVTYDLTHRRLTAPDGSTTGVVGAARPLVDGLDIEVDPDLEIPPRTHLLEQIFEQLPVSLYVKDTEGRHLLMSAHHASRVDATGKTDLELFDPELSRETYADDMHVVETGEPVHNAEEYNPEEDIWVLTSKVPWYDRDGQIAGLVGVTRHITEKKEYEQAIERENERLERLAGVISHDLRNPLNVAQGRLELLRNEVESEHAETIADALDRMETIIADVLTLARQGQTVDDPHSVGLAATAEEAWGTTDTGEATLETGTDARFLAHPGRLVELFGNLFRNAVEHGSTSPGSQARQDPVEHAGETVTVRVEAIDDGFAVSDDGCGIPEDERATVFEPGYTTAEDGTGFGLAIIREIADAHGWDLTVTESVDGGARFEVTGVEFVE
jgi:PAS domain S-box-containing protein